MTTDGLEDADDLKQCYYDVVNSMYKAKSILMNFSPDPRMNSYFDKVIDSGDPVRINALKDFNQAMLSDLYRMVNMNTLSEYRKICDHFHVTE